jgi:hypothetical protein
VGSYLKRFVSKIVSFFQAEEKLRLCEDLNKSDASKAASTAKCSDLYNGHSGPEQPPVPPQRELDGGESVLNVSCSSCSDLSTVEQSLVDAERKIAKLLKMKEKLVAIEVSLIFCREY